MGGVLRHAVVVVVVLLPLPLLTTAVSARTPSHRLDCFPCTLVPIFSFLSFGDKNCIQP
jgi:bacteriorhodopsin